MKRYMTYGNLQQTSNIIEDASFRIRCLIKESEPQMEAGIVDELLNLHTLCLEIT